MAIPKVLQATEDVLIDRLAKYAPLVTNPDTILETGFYTYVDEVKYFLKVETCSDGSQIMQTRFNLSEDSYMNEYRISYDGGTSWSAWKLSNDTMAYILADQIFSNLYTRNPVLEIFQVSKTIATTDWVEDTEKSRYTATISDTSITSDRDVDIVIADAQKGLYNIVALDPAEGSVTVFTDSLPEENISVRLIIRAVLSV